METISYRELIKKVHPDLNPSIQNPGEKIAQAKKHKDNPGFLYNLGVRWGVIQGKENQQFNNTTFTGNSQSNLTFVAGNVVFIAMRKTSSSGVIVDVVSGKGKRKCYNKVFFVELMSHRIRYFYIPKSQTDNDRFGNIRIIRIGNQSEVNRAYEKYNQFVKYKEEVKNYKKRKKQENEETLKNFLSPNTDYTDRDVWVYARTLKRNIKVRRTTNKRVYYWCERTNKERFVNMSSVRFWTM